MSIWKASGLDKKGRVVTLQPEIQNGVASGSYRKSRIGRLQAQKEIPEWEGCMPRQKSQNMKAAGPDRKCNMGKLQTHRKKTGMGRVSVTRQIIQIRYGKASYRNAE